MTTSRANPGTEVGVRYEQNGPVATVTLCRPEVLNAQTPAMWTELDAISRKLPGDVRVVIVRGAGHAFSAGLDLSFARGEGDFSLAELGRLPPEECAQRIATFQSAFTWLRGPSLVTIAAVRGYAIGAGFQLALACDLRVLADDASFTMAESRYGLVPDLGGTHPLVAALLSPPPEVATETKALLLGALGRDRDGQEAAERAAQLRRLRALAGTATG